MEFKAKLLNRGDSILYKNYQQEKEKENCSGEFDEIDFNSKISMKTKRLRDWIGDRLTIGKVFTLLPDRNDTLPFQSDQYNSANRHMSKCSVLALRKTSY